MSKKPITADLRLIDSHCHLLDEPLFSKLPEVIQAAFVSGVGAFIVPCSHAHDMAVLANLLTPYPNITPAFGVHPFYVHELALDDALALLRQHLEAYPQALVGEIGLDWADKHLSDANRLLQQDFFAAQLQTAQQYQRPVILHYRQSLDDMLAVVKTQQFQYGGFLHGYSGSIEQARPWLQLGFKLGLGSVLLKPNARKIYQLLPHLTSSDYVLETDAPYMVSSAMNQAYNEPKFVRAVAETLADFYQCAWQDIAAYSSANVASVLKPSCREE
ncbi:TatD family hydrolase [Vitreoscilla massiliensis]|uniref:TatD family hydrolase n=1 Tax=Vitreoscilla massiliensis TaxID=1689272 RepID=A0ABY4E2D2_9NEIS|nr:TatD family hydrolase [Vitreoscilla massiliensis]UOO89687.1 TatD family hydrolase [Vitreoscilla massiliensis]